MARRRWALNAVRAKERKRLAQALAAPEAIVPAKLYRPRRGRADLRVILERADGERVQYTAHFYEGKLFSAHFTLSPKQFGRKLGEIFHLWMQP